MAVLPSKAQDSSKAEVVYINIPLPDTSIQYPVSSHAYGPPEWRSRAGLVWAKGLHIQHPASSIQYPAMPTAWCRPRASTSSIYPYNKKRVRLVTIGNIVGYGSTLIGFYGAWYKNYPQTNFHSFNDSREWLQVDKLGHLYGAYVGGNASMEMWRWTGIDRKKRIWLGGLSGVAYQTIIETLDGFSKGWGWSWSDMGANVLGSGLVIGQELAWDEQRIRIKFSVHRRSYGDANLNQRANSLFGKGSAERFIKDYNAQTYWASVNLRSFFPKSRLPRWLNVAVGYGAEGLFGAESNIGKDDNGNVVFNRPDIKRYRQWFIAPDIDLTKIPTKKKGVRLLLGVLNAFKFPAPSLELSNGKLRVNGFHF